MNATRDEVIASVRALVEPVRDRFARIEANENEYELRIEVQAHSERHCSFELAFSHYSTFDLSFGHGLRFEYLPISEYSAAEITEALLNGRVKKRVWFSRGKVTKATGEISLQDGRGLYDSATDTLCGLLGLGTERSIEYEPYR